VRDYLSDLLELHEAVAADRPRRDELIVSAGGSAYLDVVADVVRLEIEAEADGAPARAGCLRSGASLLHDDGFYHGISPLDGDRATAGHAALASAMRGYAASCRIPSRASRSSTAASATSPTTRGCPCRSAWRPRSAPTRRRSPGHPSPPLNDQHAFLRSDARCPSSIGDVVSLGLSHPCTAVRQAAAGCPVVERAGSTRVVDLVRTFF
jgi:D-serine deaminase-like pyridoxal phosphate-dependent protein